MTQSMPSLALAPGVRRMKRFLFALFLSVSVNFANAAPITISNATTSLTVNGGEANNGLVPFNGYLRYTDIAAGEEVTWSIDPLLVFSDGSTNVLSNGMTGGFGSPVDIGSGVIRSTVTVPGTIDVEADTELVGSNVRTTFSFSDLTGGGLDGTTFVYYAENDIFAFSNDTATFTGSIVGGDLALFQFDSAAETLTVRITGEEMAGATLSLFGAGLWTAWGTALESGDLSVLSSDGSNFATVGDLGLALAFNLTGSSAELVVNYDTQPQPPTIPIPIPQAAWLFGSALGLLGWMRRRKAV